MQVPTNNPSGVRTLVLIRRGNEVLLGQKKRGFGVGHWNGFGGKVEPGETIPAAAAREVQEECGLIVDNLKQIGQILFTFAHDPLTLDMHLFTASTFSGQLTETDEMAPRWFPVTAVPFDQMWADDPHWFPFFVAGKHFTGHIHFANWDTIDSVSLNEVAPQEEPWHISSVS